MPVCFKLVNRVAALLLTAVVAGCSSDASGPSVAACAEGTQVTVARGASGPTINWMPRCAVSFVAIVQDEDNTLAWGIRTPRPQLTPPQQAYVTPNGAFELGNSRALRAGSAYTIILGVRDTNDVSGAIGERAVGTLPYVP